MFDFAESPLPVRPDISDAFRRVWTRLAAPGTWWRGRERVTIAAVARDAYSAGEATRGEGLPEAAVDAAVRLSNAPSTVTRERIGDWETRGLDANRYVELIGVVAQLTTVDTFHRALEIDLETLPAPDSGEPTQELPEPVATVTKAWVPIVGPPSIPTSLSAVPDEMQALEDLHGALYLRYGEMGDPAISRGLPRAQMELVASRTSAINECFF